MRRHHYYEELASAKSAREARARTLAEQRPRELVNRFWREFYRLQSSRCADPRPSFSEEIMQRLRVAMLTGGMIEPTATDGEIYEKLNRWLGSEGYRSDRGQWIERVLSK